MNTKKYISELSEFLAIPTISAQKKHVLDMKKGCVWLETKLKSLGFEVDILPTKGHMVVYAENLKAGSEKPTILVYGHYDVQSPDPISEWTSDPFKPEIRNGNIYGRGTSDDKGQLYTWIAGLDELTKDGNAKTRKPFPINIKFLIEGEEEIGSKNLNDFIHENQSLLTADIAVISDTHCLSETVPLICYGLRGLCYMQINVKCLGKDAHSGLYGGNVYNPANVLAQIITKLKDENHKIRIPGFYDNVRVLTKDERDKLSLFPFKEREVCLETGAEIVVGEKEYSVIERAGARPTLDVNGIWGGYQEEGPKTIIPAEVNAKISMRLVPNQSSEEIAQKFTDYVRTITPQGISVEIEELSGGEPILMDTGSKYFKAAEMAYKKVFGRLPLYELSGGSIPVTAIFKRLLNIDSVLMGYGLPDDGLHSPNEKLSLNMFERGIRTNLEFLKNLK